MKLLLLNGPPRCGKDTIGAEVAKIESRALICKFAAILKVRTHALYGIVDGDGVPRPADYFEHVKDLPNDRFLGLTPRKAYIEVSERYFKPVHGQDVFGRLLAADLLDNYALGDRVIVVTDSGFAPEAEALRTKLAGPRTLIAQIHRLGTSFIGDSRGFVTIPGVPMIEVANVTPQDPSAIAALLLHNLDAA